MPIGFEDHAHVCAHRRATFRLGDETGARPLDVDIECPSTPESQEPSFFDELIQHCRDEHLPSVEHVAADLVRRLHEALGDPVAVTVVGLTGDGITESVTARLPR